MKTRKPYLLDHVEVISKASLYVSIVSLSLCASLTLLFFLPSVLCFSTWHAYQHHYWFAPYSANQFFSLFNQSIKFSIKVSFLVGFRNYKFISPFTFHILKPCFWISEAILKWLNSNKNARLSYLFSVKTSCLRFLSIHWRLSYQTWRVKHSASQTRLCTRDREAKCVFAQTYIQSAITIIYSTFTTK